MVAKSLGKSLLESIGITDSVAIERGRFQSITDTVGVSDLVQIERGLVRSDSVQITDTIILDQSYVKKDAVGITDYFSATIPIREEIADAVGITDSVVIEVTEGHVRESFMSLVDDKRELAIAYLLVESSYTETELRAMSIHDLAHKYWSHKSGDFEAPDLSIIDHLTDFDPGSDAWDWLNAIT